MAGHLGYEVIDRNIVRLIVKFGGVFLESFVVPRELRREAGAEKYWNVYLANDSVSLVWNRSTSIEFSTVKVEEDTVHLRIGLEDGDHVYGLGEKYGLSIDRRFKRFHVWNAPQPHHLPSGDPMYISVPVVLVARPGKAYAVYIDYPGYLYVDTGVDDPRYLGLRVGSKSFHLYVIAGYNVAEVVEAFSRLVGRPYFPPKWALGYHQSRYSYESSDEAIAVARKFRELRIPCDAIYLDIDYMDGYRVFTWNRDRFPDPRRLAEELHRLGFRLVTIVDVGVKAEEGYEAYERGLEASAFARNREGGLFKGGVWPGYCVFPDFFNRRGREYWAGLVASHLATGIDGIWLDMNEPEIFYMEEPLKALVEELYGLVKRGDDERAGELLYWEGIHRVWTGGSKARGFKDIGAVHLLDDGSTIDHYYVHNAYPLLEAAATLSGFKKAAPGKRWFILSRSGFAGIQKYSAVWTGDNESDWGHMAASIPMILNLGLSGIPFAGADVGGFSDDADPEMLVRWTQLGAFYPLFRNHSSKGTRRQEPWVFGEPYTTLVAEAIKLRYSLLPYIYSLFLEAHRRGLPIARPLFMEFPDDEETYTVSDEFMLGPSLLVAPVLAPGSRARAVYLPGSEWLDLWDKKVYGKGWHLARAPLGTIPLFLRKDRGILTTSPHEKATDPWKPLKLTAFLENKVEERIYDDDGDTLNYAKGQYYEVVVSLKRVGSSIKISLKPVSLDYSPGFDELEIKAYATQDVSEILVEGAPTRFEKEIHRDKIIVKTTIKLP